MCTKGGSKVKENSGQPVKGGSIQDAVFILAVYFLASLLALSYIYFCFPELEEHERKHVKLPWDIEDAKKLGEVLARYKDRYYFEVLTAVFATYIFLQTFAIPGSISLSILSGFLFPFPLALLLVCFCSATGATLCYLLSSQLGRCFVYKFWPARANKWAATVQQHKDNLLSYMLFLRITPLLPNWFINIVAPIIYVPVKIFWLGTFLGVAPPSFIAIQAGQTLQELTTAADAKLSWGSLILLVCFGVLAFVPVIFKAQLRSKFE